MYTYTRGVEMTSCNIDRVAQHNGYRTRQGQYCIWSRDHIQIPSTILSVDFDTLISTKPIRMVNINTSCLGLDWIYLTTTHVLQDILVVLPCVNAALNIRRIYNITFHTSQAQPIITHTYIHPEKIGSGSSVYYTDLLWRNNINN